MSNQIFPRPEGHQGYTVENFGKKHKAVCQCGWKSDQMSSAGMAGGAWDDHVLRMAQSPSN